MKKKCIIVSLLTLVAVCVLVGCGMKKASDNNASSNSGDKVNDGATNGVIEEVVTDAATGIKEAATDVKDGIKNAATDAYDAVKEGATNVKETVTEAMSNMNR